MPRLSRRGFLVAGAATAMTAACSSELPPVQPPGDRLPDKVVLLTGPGSSIRDTFVHAGIAKGIFAKSGVEVTVTPGTVGDGNLKTLIGGGAQFALIDYASAMTGTKTYSDADAEPMFKVISTLHRSSLLGLVAADGLGVTRPADLAGKAVTAVADSPAATLFPVYAKAAGLDPAKVRVTPGTAEQAATQLAARQTAAFAGYPVDGPPLVGGRKPLALSYAAHLGDLYGSVLTATAAMTLNNSALVVRFHEALLGSFAFAVTNPAEAAGLVKQAIPATDEAAAAEALRSLAPLAGDGMLEWSRVERGIAMLKGSGLILESLNPDKLVAFGLFRKPSPSPTS